MAVRGSFFPVNQVLHSGAASFGFSSQGSRFDHRLTTSYGARAGTTIATTTREAMIPNPTSPDLIRRASRNAALKPIGAGAAEVSPPQRPDAGVQEPVEQVEHEHCDHEEVRVQRDDPDYNGSVEHLRRLEGEKADPLIIEDRLGD